MELDPPFAANSHHSSEKVFPLDPQVTDLVAIHSKEHLCVLNELAWPAMF